MKILESLEKYDSGLRLKIGCKKKSGYWYVGTVGDFRDNINDYNKLIRLEAAELVETGKRELEKAYKSRITPEAYARDQISKRIGIITVADYMEELERYFKKIKAKLNTIEKRERYLATLVPLKNREVLEQFIADPVAEPYKCLALRIEGSEPGGYWMTEEAEELPAVSFNEIGDNDSNE